MPETRPERGLLDTSVVVDLELFDPVTLPRTVTISALTLVELACGPHATSDPHERARRQETLQRVEANIEALDFDAAAARAYARVFAAVRSAGQKARGARAVDLMIAATALSTEQPLVTRNAADFRAVTSLITVIAV